MLIPRFVLSCLVWTQNNYSVASFLVLSFRVLWILGAWPNHLNWLSLIFLSIGTTYIFKQIYSFCIPSFLVYIKIFKGANYSAHTQLGSNVRNWIKQWALVKKILFINSTYIIEIYPLVFISWNLNESLSIGSIHEKHDSQLYVTGWLSWWILAYCLLAVIYVLTSSCYLGQFQAAEISTIMIVLLLSF